MTSGATGLRETVQPGDPQAVREITAGTGFFRDDEIDVAVELVQERLDRGAASGYEFLFTETEGVVTGYVCYGRIACTTWSWDLYWIAVRAGTQGKGVGTHLIRETEKRVAATGGGRIYVETSSRDHYTPTRAFYERRGYLREAVLEDFYAPGDGKVVYVKRLA